MEIDLQTTTKIYESHKFEHLKPVEVGLMGKVLNDQADYAKLPVVKPRKQDLTYGAYQQADVARAHYKDETHKPEYISMRQKHESRNRSIAVKHPYLAAEWAKSNNASAAEVFPRSKVCVKWQCPRDPAHVYEATPYDRITLGVGCAYCAGRQVLGPNNSLAARYPSLLEEWDYESNKDLKPDSLVWNDSKEQIWWKCKKGHTWKSTCFERTIGTSHQGTEGLECRFCEGLIRQVDRVIKSEYRYAYKKEEPVNKNRPSTKRDDNMKSRLFLVPHAKKGISGLERLPGPCWRYNAAKPVSRLTVKTNDTFDQYGRKLMSAPLPKLPNLNVTVKRPIQALPKLNSEQRA